MGRTLEIPEATVRTYFWAYDLFGYLLPGLLIGLAFLGEPPLPEGEKPPFDVK